MLARRLLFKFAIVILVTKVNCQYEEYRGDSDDEDEDAQSRYSDDSGDEPNHPDYSRYYNGNADNKAPLSVPFNGGAGGFVSPIEFQSFFGQGGFGFGSASSKQEILKPANSNEESNGFVRSDEFRNNFGSSDSFSPNYFEKTASSEIGKPVVKNSNYASKAAPGDEEYDKSETYDLNKKPKNGKYYKDNVKVRPGKTKISSTYKANKTPGKYNGYYGNPGYTPQYNSKHTKTPYQKYSFQPVSYLSSDPYNPSYNKYAGNDYPYTPTYDYQPTEIVSQTLQARDCKRIEKKLPNIGHGSSRRNKRESMQCYICKDPSTGEKYEQCSYSSQTEPTQKTFETGSVEKYSQSNGNRYRFKRYTQKQKKKEQLADVVDVADQDPYEYVKSYSAPYHSQTEEGEEGDASEGKGDYYKSDEYGDSDEYRFGPEYFTDLDSSKEEKSSSEIHSEKLKKNADSCKKVKHGSMTCVVCKNLKTGDNYEQCSYSSEPNEKKYAYVKEKKYNSNDDPGYEEEDTDSTHTKPVYKEDGAATKGKAPKQKKLKKQRRSRHPLDKGDFGGYDKPKSGRVIEKRQDKPKNKLVEDDPYDIPKHFNDDVHNQKDGFQAPDSIDEYHFKVFPEYASKESKQEETRINPYFRDDEDDSTTKKDVEDVLADFAKKNRSDCKKVLKQGMTCFLCADNNGLQNEECMYVSESKPQGSHLAYHEVKEYKTPGSAESESKINAAVAPKEQQQKEQNPKRRKLSKKVSVAATGSTTSTTLAPPPKTYTARSKVPRQYRRKNNIPSSTTTTTQEPEVAESRITDQRKRKPKEDEVEPTIKTPKEFDVHGTEGAFSSETKPVFSKKLGFSLPRFMLEKSPDQIEFEEFEKNG